MTKYEELLDLIVASSNSTQCVIWPHCPQLKTPNGTMFVHRAAYEHAIGKIPEGSLVVAQCGNNMCFQPSHLILKSKYSQLTAEEKRSRSIASGNKFRNDHRDQLNASKRAKRTAARLSAGRLTGYERMIVALNSNYDPTQCLIWTGHRTDKGYGQISFKRNGIKHNGQGVHRVSFELTNGPIPEGMFVCHSCDNPPCFNPRHLWLGTASDNINDAFDKGRKTVAHGEDSASHVLTEKQVNEIRTKYALKQPLSDIASEYGICESTVCKLGKGYRWKHLPMPQLEDPPSS